MNELTRALLAGTRNIAREQIERVFDERVEALRAGVERAVAESLARARRELTGRLNQSLRRLLSSSSREYWSKALVDAAQAFCDRAALFGLEAGALRLEASRNIGGALNDVPLDGAPAFRSAAESRDTVVALRTMSEMSDPIARWAGEAREQKFHVLPIVAGDDVTALLYADSAENGVDTDGLELVAMMAGAAVQNRLPAGTVRPELVNIGTKSQSVNDPDLHLKAQRFARNQAAEIRLYKSENVKNGRADRNLYASLKEEIDSAREAYRQEFLGSPGTTVDYLHQELVRTLANNDVELLGPDYPGPLA